MAELPDKTALASLVLGTRYRAWYVFAGVAAAFTVHVVLAVAARSFTVLFIAEFGDLTQLATANLAARYHDPASVGAGAVLGLWAAGGLAIAGGRQLLRVVPFHWITRTAAAVMTVLCAASLVTAIAG